MGGHFLPFRRIATALTAVVALALFGSLISLYYYLTIIKAMFLPAGQPPLRAQIATNSLLETSNLAVLAAIVLFLGIAPATLLSRILSALT